jgi:hypothetical protein
LNPYERDPLIRADQIQGDGSHLHSGGGFQVNGERNLLSRKPCSWADHDMGGLWGVLLRKHFATEYNSAKKKRGHDRNAGLHFPAILTIAVTENKVGSC